MFSQEFMTLQVSHYEFGLLNSGGSRQFDTTAIVTRYEQRIAMTVLADFILLGHGGTGSYSLAGNKTRLFAVALESYLDNITNVFNDYAIPKLFEINGMDTTKLPMLRHSDLETPSLQELAQYISTLAGSGMQIFPDQKLEEYLRQIATLPKADDLQIICNHKTQIILLVLLILIIKKLFN